MTKEKRVLTIARTYYSRKDIQDVIYTFCRERETIPRYIDSFGKRPDTLEFPTDLMQQAKKGASSFHCSEELWEDPMQISTDLTPEQFNEIRQGWDLLIDIDSKYLDYSKIAAELIIGALKFHNIRNFGLKFSGSKGFHIIIPWKAFPPKLRAAETKDMFPEWPRIISLYLTDLIKKKLIEKITELSGDRKSYVKDFEAPKKVMPDIVLVSPRHLFRTPYSLHEKTCLSSVVLDEHELTGFQPKLADPLRVKIKDFYPQVEQDEARELLISALDWFKEHKKEVKKDRIKRKFQEIKIDKSKIVYPPAISEILKGGLKDGKKRALFILINYFRSLGLSIDDIEKKILEWNKKNKPNLKENYIAGQLNWYKRQKPLLPPNYDKDHYKAIGIIPTEEEMRFKNPVNYSVKKSLGGRKKSKK